MTTLQNMKNALSVRHAELSVVMTDYNFSNRYEDSEYGMSLWNEHIEICKKCDLINEIEDRYMTRSQIFARMCQIDAMLSEIENGDTLLHGSYADLGMERNVLTAKLHDSDLQYGPRIEDGGAGGGAENTARVSDARFADYLDAGLIPTDPALAKEFAKLANRIRYWDDE